MSKIYSQLAEKWHAFVQHFSGRTFYVNAVAKIMGSIDTWEFGPGIIWVEGAGFTMYTASDVRLWRRTSTIYSTLPIRGLREIFAVS